MNKQPSSTIMKRLCWGAFFLVLLFLAFQVIPRALGQRDASKRSVAAHMSQVAQSSQSQPPTFPNGPTGGGVCQYAIAPGTDTIVPGTTDTGSHCDDCDTLVSLPFSFQLYDQTYVAVNVSSNGRLDFAVANEPGGFITSCLPAPPNIGPYDFTIFGLWHDQQTDLGLSGCASFPGGTCGVFTSVSGSAPDRVFNIEFRTVRFADNTQTENYEVRLYENPALNKRFDVIYGMLNGVLDVDTAGVQGDAASGFFTEDFCNVAAPQNVSRTYIAVPCGTPTPTPACTPGWSAGADLPSVGTRLVGVHFPANGRFYAMGGRSSDAAGSDFTNPFEYNPNTDTWVTKGATYPDNEVNNMACGVLTDAGTPYIYCVGGSAAGAATATGRVFRYSPVFDAISPVAAPWPGAGAAAVVPGGFTVFQNKLYILGGFDIPAGNATSQIWEFTPGTNAWVQKAAVLPVPRGYIPTTTIGTLIFTGGGSDITGGVLTDTTDSFVYNPVGDSIAPIASIPRATGETRALNFNNQMWVLGGGRTAPNPSNEVNIYDPVGGTWTTGLPFTTARRNFPADTDGSTRIWLAGGYDGTGVPVSSMEIFCEAGPTPTPTPTATPTATPTPGASPTPTATTSTFGNISTRLRVEMGDNVLIGGFIITGTQPKETIVRAIGPSLPLFGTLADPILELRNSSGGLIASNDNWRSSQEAEIIATGIPPTNDLESAIVATLPANNSAYTAIVRGVNNGTGIGVVEAYDLDRTVDSKLANISTRGFVQTGDNVMIGGLIVLGQDPLRVIVRAIGPSLPVSGALADPTLELHDGNGALIAFNDNWRTDQEAEIIATTIPPTNDLESAIVRDLTPGAYTAIVGGVNGTTGIAVVEAYGLN